MNMNHIASFQYVPKTMTVNCLKVETIGLDNNLQSNKPMAQIQYQKASPHNDMYQFRQLLTWMWWS